MCIWRGRKWIIPNSLNLNFEISLTEQEIRELQEWADGPVNIPPPDAYFKIYNAMCKARHKAVMDALKKALSEVDE